MSDVYIFAFGCFVTLIVSSAVGLLLWGAANEPRPGQSAPERARGATSGTPRPRAAVPNSSTSVE